jgi:Fis family transcriptional regulator, factor for inversion stimulation protein
VTLRALLLADATPELVRACADARLEVVRVGSIAEGLMRLARDRFALVDERLARPRPLEDEIQHRLDAFFDRLRGHAADGLYDAVMQQVERPLITSALARTRGVRSAAAEALGIDRGTLARRMRALRLDGT